MEIAAILIILATLLASAAVLIRPFTRQDTPDDEDPLPVLQHDLEEVRKQLQEMENGPDAARFTAKELEERLTQLGAREKDLNQQIAALIEKDPVERAVQELRMQNAVDAVDGANPRASIIPARFCQSCGKALNPGHRFCPSCGKPAGKDQR
jgi:rRNA maturation endonuclease Nob1